MIIFRLTLFITFVGSMVFAQSFRSKINDGNNQYNEEKYEEALNSYQDALIDDPQSAIAHFNRADAFYKMEKYDEALEEYQKALSAKDVAMEARIHYNIANTYFKQDKLQESIESYIISLDLNPNDKDAKYNLELARAKLKEKAEKQKMEGNNQQDQKIEPSEFAKETKKQAEALVAQRKYTEALNLMLDAERKDQTILVYKDFTNRINDIVGIEANN